jgi:hypothetical protein
MKSKVNSEMLIAWGLCIVVSVLLWWAAIAGAFELWRIIHD